MKLELLEADDFAFQPPCAPDNISDSDPHEVVNLSESVDEKGVLWNGHFITPDAVFEETDNFAINADPKTKIKVQDQFDCLAKARAEEISEKNRLLLLRDIKIISGATKNEQGIVHHCAQKRGWIGEAAHKVANFVREHKVSIIAGIVVFAPIVTVAAVVGGSVRAALGGLTGDDESNPSHNSTSQGGISRTFVTEGVIDSSCRIGGINGINNSYDDAVKHAAYLSGFTSNHSVEWVYNHSNGLVIDVAEAGLNILGQSPKTGQLLKENWIKFHEQNKDNPSAKYLQFCHSQGAIHVRNELDKVAQEIRDRIIVVAIAPVVIVPNESCFRSYNYASKNDIMLLVELAFAAAINRGEYGTFSTTNMAQEHRKELIILEPHPDATRIDHNFQSPTYMGIIEERINDYLEHQGRYA